MSVGVGAFVIGLSQISSFFLVNVRNFLFFLPPEAGVDGIIKCQLAVMRKYRPSISLLRHDITRCDQVCKFYVQPC